MSKESEILRLTNDGDNLMNWQLSLVESSINGNLNDLGRAILDKLHELVKNGEKYRYTVSGFFKKFDLSEEDKDTPDHPYDVVEELDYDCEGYIRWKGKSVEHFNHPEDPNQIPYLWEIVKKCQHIESIGAIINTNTVVWYWDWYKEIEKDCPYKDFFVSLYTWFVHSDGQQAVIVTHNVNGEGFLLYTRQNQEWQKTVFTETAHDLHQQMKKQGFITLGAMEQGNKGLYSIPLKRMMEFINTYQVPSDLVKLN